MHHQHYKESNCYVEEDEIDLKELFSTIWRYKLFIAIFSFFVTLFAIFYALKLPNVYSSETILIPKDNEKPSLSSGAAAMAAMAGINIGGGGGIDVAGLFKNLIQDYSFNKKVILKYNLESRLLDEVVEKNFVFALGYKGIYDLFKVANNKNEVIDREDLTFETFKKIKKILSVSTDKESGAITLSAKFEDRFATKELVEIYLKEMSNYIRKLDFKEIDEQVGYYQRELKNADSVDLKANINQLLSALVKKKVLSQAGEYYMVKQLTEPQVAYIKDKVGPKRALIVIVAFITSIILAIFLVFFREFLKNSNQRESEISF